MMDGIKHENTKLANQAWRKKPRKFAPKSRLGCKTCKIRRIKCDLSRPSCMKCLSTGRTCDGYSEVPLAFKPDIDSGQYPGERANSTEACYSYDPCTTISAYEPHPRYWQANYTHHRLALQNLRPLMILPVTGPAQIEAMSFFEYDSIKHLNEYHPSESWRNTLMFFSQTVPSVRHAATALALIHRDYLDRDSKGRVHPPPDKASLLHYNRAIQLVLNQDSGDSTETTAITLLVCYLFTCFDHLASNYVQAMKHLRGGVELSRNIDKAISDNNNTSDDTNTSGLRTLICQVTRQLRRLDMQAVTFLVDWTPADNEEPPPSQLPLSNYAFRSLEQAADQLQILVARAMKVYYANQQNHPTDDLPPSLLPVEEILRQLESWSSLFENMLHQTSFHESDSESHRLISLLRLHYTIPWILISSHGSSKEMGYDNYLPQFQQCLAFAGDIAAAHERYSGSLKPTFTPEVGIIPALYIIGAKCRHPTVRRQVLSILRRRRIREAVWDSTLAARVVERVIEIEEGGPGSGERAQGMNQIAAWQRIEALSWIHVVDGPTPARLDITYTFCAREEVHTESLVL